jgi:aspartate/tyrosine/aromatic aminotransferase
MMDQDGAIAPTNVTPILDALYPGFDLSIEEDLDPLSMMKVMNSLFLTINSSSIPVK